MDSCRSLQSKKRVPLLPHEPQRNPRSLTLTLAGGIPVRRERNSTRPAIHSRPSLIYQRRKCWAACAVASFRRLKRRPSNTNASCCVETTISRYGRPKYQKVSPWTNSGSRTLGASASLRASLRWTHSSFLCAQRKSSSAGACSGAYRTTSPYRSTVSPSVLRRSLRRTATVRLPTASVSLMVVSGFRDFPSLVRSVAAPDHVRFQGDRCRRGPDHERDGE